MERRSVGDEEGLELHQVWAAPPGAAAVVAEVSLSLRPGEVGVLLGGNGAGKTTLLRTAAGLWPPVSGRVTGAHGGTFDPALSGLVLEEPASQFVTGTVREELEFVLENLETPRPGIGERVDGVLESLGILHLARRDPRSLSAGEQQRALVAAALVPAPRLIFMDDPFLHLGEKETVPIWAHLRERVREGEIQCLLLATQDVDLAADADRVGVLGGHRLLAWGSPEEVLPGELPPEIGEPFSVRLLERVREWGWEVPGRRLDASGLARRLAGAIQE